jgi:hypothetical protein
VVNSMSFRSGIQAAAITVSTFEYSTSNCSLRAQFVRNWRCYHREYKF